MSETAQAICGQSTPPSLARLLLGLCFICLIASGCVAPSGTGGQGEAVSIGGLQVGRPSGFCVVKQSLVEQATTGFAALAPCSPGSAVQSPAASAVLTVTVGETGTANTVDLSGPALGAYFTSPEGLVTLSSEGRAGSVRVHEVWQSNGVVTLRLTDNSARWPGLSWRAVLALQGHLVTLTLQGTGQTGLTEIEGRRLMGRFATAMRRANAG
ncbi:MAG: hypothetical protein ACJASV_000966 [Pseudorhodobacter sp.]|jgi:hypothetical protein